MRDGAEEIADFNPRSREGSDREERESIGHTCISIHAPAKGATDYKQLIKNMIDISIHAPAKGATCLLLEAAGRACISIHAPAKGATF